VGRREDGAQGEELPGHSFLVPSCDYMVMRTDLKIEFKAWQLEREARVGIEMVVWPARWRVAGRVDLQINKGNQKES
jgi:hypothetical protein